MTAQTPRPKLSPIRPLTEAQLSPPEKPPKRPQVLGFRDGFDFGCGFWSAAFFFTAFAVPAGLFLFAFWGALLGAFIGR